VYPLQKVTANMCSQLQGTISRALLPPSLLKCKVLPNRSRSNRFTLWPGSGCITGPLYFFVCHSEAFFCLSFRSERRNLLFVTGHDCLHMAGQSPVAILHEM